MEFVSTYKIWIETQRDSISELKDYETATQNVDACETDYERMKHNVMEFLSDSAKMKAFRTMNAAMFMQLWHNKKENQKRLEMKNLFWISISTERLQTTYSPKLNMQLGDHSSWRLFF